MPVEWTEARIYKLVLSYLRHECLWKDDSNSYNDLEARYAAYLSIIRDLNIRDLTVNEVRDKIKQIRRSYRTELAKINEANFRGAPYKPKITWFELLHEFLCAYITGADEEDPNIDSLPPAASRNCESQEYNSYICRSLSNSQRQYPLNERRYFPIRPNLDTCPTKLTKNGIASQARLNSTLQHDAISSSQHFITQQIRNIGSLPHPGDCSAIRTPDTEVGSQIASSVKKHKSQKKYGDEFDVFGKSVACQLRELSLPHALRTQAKIQSLLAEERIHSNQEMDNESVKKDSHRHRHADSRVIQSSRSSHSNFQCPSASDLSSYRGPSNGRQSKRAERNQTDNCRLDNSQTKQRYKKTCLKT